MRAPERSGRRWLNEFLAIDVAAQEPFCRSVVDYRDPAFDRCSVEVVGNGAAAVLSIATSSGGDSCAVRAWVLSNHENPFEIPDAGGAVEVAPDLSFVLVDREHSPPHAGYSDASIVTVRIEIPLRKETIFSSCFSPKLSPAGTWFVCRDSDANVLRIPVHGGSPEIVARSGYTRSDIVWSPHSFSYPEPVTFTGADQLEFTIDLRNGSTLTRRVSWTE